MKTYIIHVSDIHFNGNNNSFLEKADKFFDVFKNDCFSYDLIFLIFTGDIAYSGKQDEYLQAVEFIDKIKEKVFEYAGKDLNIIMVPGNHDCDHSTENSKIREMLIEQILKDGSAIEESVIKECCEVQKEWFELSNTYRHNGREIFKDKLVDIAEFLYEDYNIIFYAYNTAWLSSKEEKPGLFYFPYKYHNEDLFRHEANLTISLFHHPINWQRHSDQRDFRAHIEETSDMFSPDMNIFLQKDIVKTLKVIISNILRELCYKIMKTQITVGLILL